MLIGVNSIFSLRASSCFIISYPLNFFMIELDRFRVTLFLHSTFFFNQKPKLVPSLEKFQKKMYFANTLFTRKHLSKNPNKVLSS